MTTQEQDAVNVAFELVDEELNRVLHALNEEGAQAFRNGEHQKVKDLAETGVTLNAFKEKVGALLAEWNRGFDRSIRRKVTLPKEFRSKGPRTRLRVSFANGSIIENTSAAESFIASLEKLGLDKVAALGIDMYGLPLVGRVKSEQYNQHLVGSYYVLTHSNTEKKKSLLEEIATRLGATIKVQIVD